MTSTKTFRGIPVSTVSDVLVILFISILAIIHLKVVIQPLVIATLIFLLIRPPANWLEQRFGHPLLAYGGLITIFAFIIFLYIFYLGNIAMNKSENLQETFLNQIRKEKLSVTIFLINGVKLQGIITWFDNFSILLKRDSHIQLVYKHSISTIMPSTTLSLGIDKTE